MSSLPTTDLGICQPQQSCQSILSYREIHTLYWRWWSNPSSRKRNAKRQNGCLRRPYKQLRKEENWKAAGNQCEESHPWQRSWGRKPDKTQRRDLASGVPPEFSWTSTSKNQSLPALLYCAFPLFWHSLEKVNSGLQSSAFERSVSAQTPRMAL